MEAQHTTGALEAHAGALVTRAQANAEIRDMAAEMLEAGLDTAKVGGGLSPPDAVLRPSGELRLSNFLLWQTAYAEFLVTETLWPDFDGPALAAALDEFSRRERRFGGR